MERTDTSVTGANERGAASRWVMSALHPLSLALGLWIGWLALSYDTPRIVAVGLPCVLAAAVVFFAERARPLHTSWARYREDLATDALHTLIAGALVPPVVDAAIRTAVIGLAVPLHELAIDVWPTELPLFAQLAIALVVSELFLYWAHRLSHRVPWLWRLHAVHHASERLYFLNSNRFHPIEAALTTTAFVLPLALLGAGADLLALHTIVNAVGGMFKHANFEMRMGSLNWVLSSGELHRWHHSPVIAESNTNYGTNLVLWDIVFGTRYLPRDREPPEEVGIEGAPYPRRYVAQLVEPFRVRPSGAVVEPARAE